MRILYIIIIGLFLLTNVKAQSIGDKASLQSEKAALNNELAQLNKEYQAIISSKNKSLATLRVIQDRIAVRQRMISNINGELGLIDNTLNNTQKAIHGLNKKLDTLKSKYAQSIVYAYKNRNSYDFLTFIFSSDNFNEALKRIQYLKEYRNYRERQAEDIRSYKNLLLGKTKELDIQKQEKSLILESQSDALTDLAGEQTDLNNTVKQFVTSENKLAQAIAKAKARQSKITQQIIAITRREEAIRRRAMEEERKRLRDIAAAKAREEARLRAEAAKANPPASGSSKKPAPKPAPEPKPEPMPELPEFTQAELNANASFESNKGRMSYPLQGGYIRTRFGLQDLGGVKWNNEGTTFECASPNTPVTAIFNGTVKTVQVDDETITIFISHGRYISVYGNMSSSTVSVGQAVTAGQVIGKCAQSEEQNGRGLLELMIFKDSKIENPERWLKK